MSLKWKGDWNTLTDFEKSLDKKANTIYRKYKDSIIHLFMQLDKNNHLNKTFNNTEINRLIKINEMSDSAFLLNRNAKHFFLNLGKIKKNILIWLLERFNFIADKESTAYQALIILCHMYQVYTEDIKKYMIISIDYNTLGLKNPGKVWFGGLLSKLKEKKYWNDFLQYLDDYNFIRNAVAHYSYYVKGKKLIFCDGPLGKERVMDISEFVNLTVDLNILSNAFIIIFKDKFVKIV